MDILIFLNDLYCGSHFEIEKKPTIIRNFAELKRKKNDQEYKDSKKQKRQDEKIKNEDSFELNKNKKTSFEEGGKCTASCVANSTPNFQICPSQQTQPNMLEVLQEMDKYNMDQKDKFALQIFYNNVLIDINNAETDEEKIYIIDKTTKLLNVFKKVEILKTRTNPLNYQNLISEINKS